MRLFGPRRLFRPLPWICHPISRNLGRNMKTEQWLYRQNRQRASLHPYSNASELSQAQRSSTRMPVWCSGKHPLPVTDVLNLATYRSLKADFSTVFFYARAYGEGSRGLQCMHFAAQSAWGDFGNCCGPSYFFRQDDYCSHLFSAIGSEAGLPYLSRNSLAG